MKFKFAKILLIFLCAILCFGCSKKDGKTVIKFSSWGSESEVSVIRPLIAEFEKQNPDVSVEFMHIPQNYFQKLHLLFASKLAPDVVFVNNINGVVYADAGLFEDLSPYLSENKKDEKDFFENSLNAFRYKNRLYAVPRDISNLVIFYNKDIFDKCHVSYPSDNWTFQDLIKTSQSLLDSKSCSQKWTIGFDKKPVFWLPFLWSNGGGIVSPDLNSIIIGKKESTEAIQFYADLKNKYKFSPSDAQKGSLTNSQLFMQGDIAMQISGRWSVPFFRENLKFDWDIVPFPSSKKGSIVDVDSSGWAMSASSPHKTQAWRFIKFMSSKSSIEKITESGLIIPSRISVAKSNVFLNPKQKPKNSKVFVTAIESGIPTPANRNYQEILDVSDKKLEAVFRGEKMASESIDEKFVKELTKLLKN